MLHRPFAEYTVLQAKSMGLQHRIFRVSGIKELELQEIRDSLKEVVKEFSPSHLVIGTLLSDYQRIRFSLIAEDLNLRTYLPLWRKNQSKYMLELIENGFEIIITSISAFGIPLKYLGKVLTLSDVLDIISRAQRYGFNPAFEGGEAETFVINSPFFRYRICIEYEKCILSQFEGYLKPIRAYLC